MPPEALRTGALKAKMGLQALRTGVLKAKVLSAALPLRVGVLLGLGSYRCDREGRPSLCSAAELASLGQSSRCTGSVFPRWGRLGFEVFFGEGFLCWGLVCCWCWWGLLVMG